ncbi:hypothetical protein BNJ_00221 [Kaumoebavirus]|uniref:hypothetical protein n=1 Tax=Kaumoebavirus TaxID=1859492 RepID=UPI0009C3D243|nr:hypothetical protein BNJ_00221 [Kaumoebavirus]ARA72050.1 hypothetical protein BNJ_00221 [Kaumoebavirus]
MHPLEQIFRNFLESLEKAWLELDHVDTEVEYAESNTSRYARVMYRFADEFIVEGIFELCGQYMEASLLSCHGELFRWQYDISADPLLIHVAYADIMEYIEDNYNALFQEDEDADSELEPEQGIAPGPFTSVFENVAHMLTV